MIKAEKLKTYDPKKFKPGYMSVKRNGVHAIYDPALGMFYSRTPKELVGLDRLCNGMKATNYPLVGELTIPGMDFETASGKLRSHNSTPEAVFSIFNCIIPGVKFKNRYDYLCVLDQKDFNTFENIVIEPMHYVDNQQYFDRFYKLEVDLGEEGVCWISSDHIYQPGKRGWDWMKRIPMKSIEVTVIDILPGTKGKKYEHSLGAFLCKMDDGKEVKVGIFKGQTDEWRQRVYDLRATNDTMKGKRITVEFKDYSKYGIPTQPRYKAERWDI